MLSDKSEKAQALDLALSHIAHQVGCGRLMRLGAAGACAEIPVLPTGSLALDAALGVGGPRGRITEIYGPEASGKTTLALHVIAEAQKAGGIAAFVDAEHALDAVYARHLGVSVHLEVRRTNVLKRGEEVVGNRTRVQVVKNKLAPSFRQAEFDVLHGQGVSRTGELLDLGLHQEFIEEKVATGFLATPCSLARDVSKPKRSSIRPLRSQPLLNCRCERTWGSSFLHIFHKNSGTDLVC